MKKIILVDGTGLIYRGFYSIPPYLKSPDGVLTNAVYGFTMILLSIIETQKPDCMVVAFDRKEKTFRHEQYSEYKATRTKAPDELFAQIPMVKEVVDACDIPRFEVAGYEADDIIATLARRLNAENPELEVMIATGDFDEFQLSNEKTSILYPTKGFRGADIFTPERIKEKYGILPNQIPDYKGLAGDSSDNIKGVRGIGDKTAVALLTEFGTLEGIYENIEKITGAKRTKLEADKESAFQSRELATLCYEVPVEFSLHDCHVATAESAKLRDLFKRLGFQSLLQRGEDAFTTQEGMKEENDFDSLFENEGEGGNSNESGAKTTQQKSISDEQASLF